MPFKINAKDLGSSHKMLDVFLQKLLKVLAIFNETKSQLA